MSYYFIIIFLLLFNIVLIKLVIWVSINTCDGDYDNRSLMYVCHFPTVNIEHVFRRESRKIKYGILIIRLRWIDESLKNLLDVVNKS